MHLGCWCFWIRGSGKLRDQQSIHLLPRTGYLVKFILFAKRTRELQQPRVPSQQILTREVSSVYPFQQRDGPTTKLNKWRVKSQGTCRDSEDHHELL